MQNTLSVVLNTRNFGGKFAAQNERYLDLV